MIIQLKEKIKNFFNPEEFIDKEIIGIDLSHDFLRVVQLTKKRDQWLLTKIATARIEGQGESSDDANLEIIKLLTAIRKKERFDTRNAAISLPINAAIIQVVQIPYLEDAQLAAAIENGSLWENSINFSGDLSEYSIFWQVVKRDHHNNNMTLLFVASNLKEVDRSCDIVRQAGFNPLFVDVRCFALRNILKTLNEPESSELSVFLEISGYENYIVFIHDDLPFIYDIFVTDADIASLTSDVENIANEVFERLLSQVNFAVRSFLAQSGESKVSKINLVSSLSNYSVILNGLNGQSTDYEMVMLDPFGRLSMSSKVTDFVSKEKNLASFTAALGLASRRLDLFGSYKNIKAVANINLLPNRQEVIKTEKTKSEMQIVFSKAAWVLSGFAILLSFIYGVVLMTLPSGDEIIELQNKLENLKSSYAKLDKDYQEYNRFVTQIKKPNQRILSTDFLREIPDGIYVAEVNQKSVDSSELVLKSSNPVLIRRLINNMGKKFKNVKLQSVESMPTDQYQTSKITYQLK